MVYLFLSLGLAVLPLAALYFWIDLRDTRALREKIRQGLANDFKAAQGNPAPEPIDVLQLEEGDTVPAVLGHPEGTERWRSGRRA